MSSDPHYRAPDWFTRNVFNRIVAAFTRVGISVWGSRILEVPGRKTGVPRRTPVNVLSLGAGRYLVAPRGHTQWVRNLRAVGEGELLLGRRREHFPQRLRVSRLLELVRVNVQRDPRISQTFDMTHSQGGLMVGGDLELALKVFTALSQVQ